MNTKPKHTIAQFALNVDVSRIESKGEYGVWQLSFVNFAEGLDKLGYPDAYDHTGRMFRDLKFRVQWDRADVNRSTYAWKLYFDDSCVESVAVAEAHLFMMKRIQNAINKSIVSPKTFGQFVTLVCHGIGVKTFVRKGEKRENHSWRALEDYYYQGHAVDEFLAFIIDAEISKHFVSPVALSA